MLSISGEDTLTIDRKNMVPLTMKLGTRIMLCTNELPRLTDSSGALANRFLILTLQESFLGREDVGLTERLLTELPGILRWAVGGWHSLDMRGHFVQPAAGREAVDEMRDLASPIGAFVRDWCVVKPGLSIPVKDLFDGWAAWCHEQGREQAGTVQVFGRDLRAAVPGVASRQPRQEGEDARQREYQGIELTVSAFATMQQWRAAKENKGRMGGAFMKCLERDGTRVSHCNAGARRTRARTRLSHLRLRRKDRVPSRSRVCSRSRSRPWVRATFRRPFGCGSS